MRLHTCSLWLMIITASVTTALGSIKVAMVNLPEKYTAMKGDIVVSYGLDSNSSFKSFNAMIHIEYLPGDAVLTNSHTSSSSIHLASLPIPMGVTKGSVVFNCGTITRAGPHRAVLTLGGHVEAVSPLLQVAWPPVSLRVPASLETYASNVEIVVAFTTTICTPLMGASRGRSNSPNNVIQETVEDLFASSLVLVECSKSLDYQGDCQMPSNFADKRIWYRSPLKHFLYRKSSFGVEFKCSVWGQEGTFRVFLTTDLTHAAIIEMSAPIEVRTNREYGLKSDYATVFPCQSEEIRHLFVKRPKCAGREDKVRVYGQGHRVVNGNFLLLQGDMESQKRYYLGEVRVPPGEKIAVFPCELFMKTEAEQLDLSTFCFHYVSRSIIGTTNTTAKLCMPASKEDLVVPQAHWGAWSSWSQCKPPNDCRGPGTRSRHRFCLRERQQPMLICQGKPVEYQDCLNKEGRWSCGKTTTTSTAVVAVTEVNDKNHKMGPGRTWRPVSPVEANSPCACGCIYIVNGRRRVDITSGDSCPSLPITWTIKASGGGGTQMVAQVHLISVEFSCANSVLNVRRRRPNGDLEMVFQTERDQRNVTDSLMKLTGKAITLSFHAPRRSCRINVESEALSVKETVPEASVHEEEEENGFEHMTTLVIMALAFLFVTVVSSLCLMCQFEYRRKKHKAWKSLPSSGYSTPTKQISSAACRQQVDTSTEDLIEPRPEEIRRQKLKTTLKRASKLIKSHLLPRNGGRSGMRRSFSEAHVIDASYEMVPLMPRRRITGHIVRRALQIKSKRYRRGHFKALNRPRTPSSTPFLSKKHSRSLADIAGLLSFPITHNQMGNNDYQECCSLEANNIITTAQVVSTADAQSGSEVSSRSVHFDSMASRRRRLLSKEAKERLLERRNRRMVSNSASNDSLATLKPTTSMSEFSEYSCHSGDPELEFDLYDCDLNNVSALPGSMFAPTVYYDVTPTEDDFEMTELFPMLRPDAEGNNRKVNEKTMVDSLTSDLAASITSDDLRYATLERKSRMDCREDDLCSSVETDALLSKKAVLNLTHIEDEVSYVDE